MRICALFMGNTLHLGLLERSRNHCSRIHWVERLSMTFYSLLLEWLYTLDVSETDLLCMQVLLTGPMLHHAKTATGLMAYIYRLMDSFSQAMKKKKRRNLSFVLWCHFQESQWELIPAGKQTRWKDWYIIGFLK